MIAHMLLQLVLAADQTASESPIVIEDVSVKLIAEVFVPATESGKLLELGVREGDLVKKGDQLGRIDDELVTIDKELAEIQLEITKAETENTTTERMAHASLDYAEKELKLSLAAVQRVQDSLPETELNRLRRDIAQSTLAIEQSRHEMRIAKLTNNLRTRELAAVAKRVDRRRVRAPLDGMIVELLAQPGEWLESKDPVVRIIKLDRLRIETHLDATKYGAELKGCPVELTVKVPPGDRTATFKGEVTFVSPEIQPVTGESRIWAEVENRNMLLRPGARGTLSISLKKPTGKAK